MRVSSKHSLKMKDRQGRGEASPALPRVLHPSEDRNPRRAKEAGSVDTPRHTSHGAPAASCAQPASGLQDVTARPSPWATFPPPTPPPTRPAESPHHPPCWLAPGTLITLKRRVGQGLRGGEGCRGRRPGEAAPMSTAAGPPTPRSVKRSILPQCTQCHTGLLGPARRAGSLHPQDNPPLNGVGGG